MLALNEAQERAVRAVLAGSNVFLTGAGGTGKTFVIERIREKLKERHGDAYASAVVFAAPTGVAAAAINGTTLNAALGIGCPRKESDFASRMARLPQLKRICAWKTMVIDEVSMVSAEFLELMDRALRRVRRAPMLAFGGLQLVVVGDFYQLPPISGNSNGGSDDAFQNWGCAFQAPAWRKANFEAVLLEEPMRQLEDPEFAALLATLRVASTPAETAAAIQAICAAARAKASVSGFASGIRPTTLYARNMDVDRINREELQRASKADGGGEIVVMHAVDRCGRSSRSSKDDPFKSCMAPKVLELCVGAQVMLLKNLDVSRGLVNGSRGVVVAIDRATMVPWVRFVAGNVTIPIAPVEFRLDDDDNPNAITRMQVPLKLAWAITVHKAQGMTLDCARVSLQALFASGQAYVALSRVRSLTGLHIVESNLSFSSAPASSACAEVHAFYQRLSSRTDEDDVAWTRWMASKRPAYGFRE
jgi:ATP-dependent DNA helicase PIF1